MSGRFYRLLLRLYPSELRHAHEREMVELAEHYRSPGLGWLLVLDLLRSLPVARWRAARQTKHTERRAEVLYSVGKEIAFAFRNLGHAPALTLLAVVTLALGIGANTAIFSVVNAVALRPLPYPEPDRLLTVWSTHKGGRRGSLSQPDLRDVPPVFFSGASPSFEGRASDSSRKTSSPSTSRFLRRSIPEPIIGSEFSRRSRATWGGFPGSRRWARSSEAPWEFTESPPKLRLSIGRSRRPVRS